MATRGQQRPSLTPPWEPLNFPDSGPPPTVGGLGSEGAEAESSGVPTRPLTAQHSRNLPGTVLPAPAPRPMPGPQRGVTCGRPGPGAEAGRAKGRPPSTPSLPRLARPGAVLESGAGFGSVSASGTGRAAGGGGAEGTWARAGGWRGVLGTGLRGRHFPGFLIAGGTAPQGAPGRARESAPNCGAGAQPPGLERSRTRASSEPFLSPAFPNLPSRASDPLGSL